ncbi:ileal sodium/bile acid cotransporter-like isoform X2 [Varroa jacobsoni]|uniref:Ileal sodium/bile acid cotransporter n=1 Tax=Varroa destructor TaxID=109461 RepID=A0A7M7JPT9_VARDE|nr:ileal sodium/bile acid cotransporter-like isoform X2 [Varroa destructor]XP_022708002.1 ileal sodium/bile acid cotransporter-like isoform X2 [Varroa jacobsoni]
MQARFRRILAGCVTQCVAVLYIKSVFKMCPMVPISLLAAILFALIEYASGEGSPKLFFYPTVRTKGSNEERIQLYNGQILHVSFWTNETIRPSASSTSYDCKVTSFSPSTANVDDCHVEYDSGNQRLNGSFRASADLLGHTDIKVIIFASPNQTYINDKIHTIVVQKQSVAQHIFLGSIILLVSLNYINMGCALDMNVIKETLRKPIGPVVGLTTQYGVMPSLSYLTAVYLLSQPYLQLGLFTFGCSPGGGASNMWTVLLGGNLNLSITMTFLSTVASLGFMPLWLFTVGKMFFNETAPRIPFRNILTGLVGIVIPVGVGLIMQRVCPKGTVFCKKILTPFSITMIVFIVIFGTWVNLYMFRLLTWEITLAAMVNVWTGFLIGLIAARVSGLSWPDAVTVMVETGIQNTGVSIVLLGVSLPKPDGDMSAIIPVTASVVTPIPLTVLWIVLKILRCLKGPAHKEAAHDKEDVRFLSAHNNEKSSYSG